MNNRTSITAISIGKKIKEIRNLKGMTQRQLSGYLDVNHVSVSLFEKGKRYPTIETLHMLSDALGVSVQFLLSCEDSQAGKLSFKVGSLAEKMDTLSTEDVCFLERIVSTLIDNQKREIKLVKGELI